MAEAQPVEQAKFHIKTLADKDADSVDSNARYMAYAARLRTALRAGHRYIAYVSAFDPRPMCSELNYLQTSDVGEAFRPGVKPWIVTAAYGVSWLYLAGYVPRPCPFFSVINFRSSDVGFETWKAQRKGPTPLEAASFTESQRLSMVAAKRGIFQAIASM